MMCSCSHAQRAAYAATFRPSVPGGGADPWLYPIVFIPSFDPQYMTSEARCATRRACVPLI